MTAFLSIAAVLTLLVVARLLWPLWRGTRRNTLTVAQLNSKVYRDQLQELERDLARGQLTEATYGEARDELQRRLLQDVTPGADAPAAAVPAGRWTAVLLAVLVPLGAAGLYTRVGNAAAIDAATRPAAPENVLAAVANLAEALRKNPDNPQGWLLLARSYRKMERFGDSAAAYDHAKTLVNQDPDLLVEQADTLIAAQGDSFEGRPMVLVQQALALEPKHPMSLMLMGMSAYRKGDFAGAVGHWQTLMTVLPEGSPEAQQVQANIDQARQEGGLSASASAAPAAKNAPPPPAPVQATGDGRVSGEVTLSPALAAQLKPDDVLFVIARPDDGSRAPVAVLRKRAGDLPLQFTLDDSLAMMPERTISKAKGVILVARISRSGQPVSQPGDLTSEATAPVPPGTTGIRLVIDRQL
ncbi:MAG: c-type cytochrome biogenesis protein CcmI [Rhizobacter sp.]